MTARTSARANAANCISLAPEKPGLPTSNLDPIRNQLDALLSPDVPYGTPPAESERTKETAFAPPQWLRFPTCAVLSMMLNIIAFCA
eukprot:2175949-Pleurochrysis_carterae.AAC.1